MWDNFMRSLKALPPLGWNLLLAVAALLTGLVFKAIVKLLLSFYSKSSVNFSLFKSAIFQLNKPFTWFLPLFTFDLVLPLMDLSRKEYRIIDKTTSIFLIAAVAFVLIAVVRIFEDLLYHVYNLKKSDNLRERKIRTQIQFIKKIVIGVIIILALGGILLSFGSLRRIGTGLLTGVGVSGIIVGFAAQRSLGNLLAGLQIAFTQPLRLDDALVAEGEFGKVEEITLTYVVLRLWDQRRLILPINYFLEKPFQNWTRTSSEILGTVFLRLDYSAPFDEIRKEFMRLLELTELWDRRVGGMQVTGASENTVEIRFVVSAANSGNAFDLRCYVREKLVTFIQKNYPESLPKSRSVIVPENSEPNRAIENLKQFVPVDNRLKTSSEGDPTTRKV
jgi:small-conductance mechanosensitive channel